MLAMDVGVCFWTTVQGCPLRLVFEESHSHDVLLWVSGVQSDQVMDITHVVAVRGKSMIDTSREYLAYA